MSALTHPTQISAMFTSPLVALRPFAATSLGLLLFAVLLWPQIMLNDGDTWWHLSAGDWIWAHHTVPHTDPFSYTFAGQPWTAHEWFSELVMSRAFAVAGWPGVMVLTAAASALGAALLMRAAGRRLHGLPLWLTVLAGLSLFAPHLLARPHMLVVPLVVIWFDGLTANRLTGRPPTLWLGLVMLLWANMHGSFLIGLALIPPFALEAVLGAAPKQRLRTCGQWAAFTAVAAGAAVMTPAGIGGLVFPVKLMLMAQVSGIGEWAALDLTRPQPLSLVLVATSAFWLMRKPRLSVVRRLILLGLVFMSLQHQRQEMILAVVGILVLAPAIAETFPPYAGDTVSGERHRSQWIIAACLLCLTVARLAVPMAAPLNATIPSTAIASLPPSIAAQPVFNDYSFGGYLIRAGIKPFIDSRADMYGAPFLARYDRMAHDRSADLGAALDQFGVRWTILKPDTPAVATMDHLLGWRRFYADDRAVIHVRISLNR